VADHPLYQADRSSIKLALREGVAEGCREHLPGAVGIVAKGVPACVIVGYVHFGLGVGVSQTAIGTILAGAGGGAADLARRLAATRRDAGVRRKVVSGHPMADGRQDHREML
jgi:hypothetical protein